MNNVTKKLSFVLVSSEKSNLETGVNQARTTQLEGFLKTNGFSFKRVKGLYKGIEETSFYVELPKKDNRIELTILKDLGRFFGQETILIANENREARLHFLLTGSEVDLGVFTQVKKFQAVDHDAYTYDYLNNGYYICK